MLISVSTANKPISSKPRAANLAALPFLIWYNYYMVTEKSISKNLIVTGIFVSILISSSGLAVKAYALSEEQAGAISQNCATTKQSLKQLQRTDARTRSYLGSAYESILSNYITPLDLRLINTGQPNVSLTNLHSDVINMRKDFVAKYTSYSQSLEELIGIDCYNHQEDFYNKLVETREKRAELSATTTNLRNLFSEHLTDVRKLRNSLGDKNAGQ